MKKLRSKIANVTLVAALSASSAAWAVPQATAPRAHGVGVTKVGYNSHHAKDQNRFEVNHQQMHTGGGGNSK